LETVDVLLTFEGTPALDINLSDDKGRTALHLAVAGNHAPIVTRLCNDNRLDVNVGDQFGETALHDACAKQNRSDIVHQLIVARGVDVNIKSKAGITPLHKVRPSLIPCVCLERFLLRFDSCGAHVERSKYPAALLQKKKFGQNHYRPAALPSFY